MAERGMGRGLAAILSVSEADADAAELREVAVELIRPNPAQPRKRFDPRGARGAGRLAAPSAACCSPCSCVRWPAGPYELVAGERRWRAARLAGLETMPGARPAPRRRRLARGRADREHGPRGPQPGRGGARGRRARRGARASRARRSAGGSGAAAWPSRTCCACSTSPTRRSTLVEAGRLSEGHGRALLLADDHADRRRLARAAADAGWSVRVLEDRAREANARPAPVRARPRDAPPRPGGGDRRDRRHAGRGAGH